jgi:hypothetical protein
MSHPAPEVSARIATDAEVPTGARRVAAVARDAGWRVVATYARGAYRAQAWRDPRVVDSLALRMWHDGSARRAIAVWHDRRFAFAVIWGADNPLATLNVTELRAVLVGS